METRGKESKSQLTWIFNRSHSYLNKEQVLEKINE